MEGQYIIQQAGRDEDDEDAPRDGELREQDRFLPIYNISKVWMHLYYIVEDLRQIFICQY